MNLINLPKHLFNDFCFSHVPVLYRPDFICMRVGSGFGSILSATLRKRTEKIQIGQNIISQRSSLNVHLQYLQENIYSMILNMNKKT